MSGKEKGGRKSRDSGVWKYEPQLENGEYPKSMMTINNLNKAVGTTRKIMKRDIVNQATDEDYQSSRWEKGHLFPKAYNVIICF